jgi:hypothetical protein
MFLSQLTLNPRSRQVRQDHPISFEKGKRKFAPRRVKTDFIAKPPFHPAQTAEVSKTSAVSNDTEEAT